MPQPPQFCASLALFTHWLLHSDWPEAQPQLPALHACPAPHVVPQEPQLVRLVCVLTQLCPHCVRPASQPALQLPIEQTKPAPHAVPQAPQLFALELSSTQLPEQFERPAAHWHDAAPLLWPQTWPV